MGILVALEYLSAGARTQPQSLLDMSQHASDVIVQNRILESLAFEGIYGRYETVDDAHFKTLHWIFNNSPDGSLTEDEMESLSSSEDDLDRDQPEEETEKMPNFEENADDGQWDDEVESATYFEENSDDGQMEDEIKSALPFDNQLEEVKSTAFSEGEAKASARESLVNWLSSGSGIFHISGKLGSGKSTLMKYLCEHDSTKFLLERWAGMFQNLHSTTHTK
jgi:hypothetical protein